MEGCFRNYTVIAKNFVAYFPLHVDIPHLLIKLSPPPTHTHTVTQNDPFVYGFDLV